MANLACDDRAVLALLASDAPRSWSDVPAVRLFGLVVGLLLIVAAIRAMFGRRR